MHPDQIERVEYEIESHGRACYEFDIKTDKHDMRIEIDAESGRIIEVSQKIDPRDRRDAAEVKASDAPLGRFG